MATRKYGVLYFRFVRTIYGKMKGPDAHGTSDNLINLVRNAAGRTAIENYKRAVIYDRNTDKILYVLKRYEGSITIEAPQGETHASRVA
jgi:hypothetical protein